jgi:hypothetical protein
MFAFAVEVTARVAHIALCKAFPGGVGAPREDAALRRLTLWERARPHLAEKEIVSMVPKHTSARGYLFNCYFRANAATHAEIRFGRTTCAQRTKFRQTNY